MSDIVHGYPDNPRIKPPTGNPGRRAASHVQSWALEVIDAPGAWLVPRWEARRRCALLTPVFSPNHQDLLPTKSDTEIESWMAYLVQETGHGTEVGGIIAAAHNTGHGRAGVCPDCRITRISGGVFSSDNVTMRSGSMRLGQAIQGQRGGKS